MHTKPNSIHSTTTTTTTTTTNTNAANKIPVLITDSTPATHRTLTLKSHLVIEVPFERTLPTKHTYLLPIYLDNLFEEVLSGRPIPLPVTLEYDHQSSNSSKKSLYKEHYYSKEELLSTFETLNIPLSTKHIIGTGITLIIHPLNETPAKTPTATSSAKTSLKNTFPVNHSHQKNNSKKKYSAKQPKITHLPPNHLSPPYYRFYIASKWESTLRKIIEPHSPIEPRSRTPKNTTAPTQISPLPITIPTHIKRTHGNITLNQQGTLIITDHEKLAFKTPQMKTPKKIPVATLGYNIFFNKEP